MTRAGLVVLIAIALITSTAVITATAVRATGTPDGAHLVAALSLRTGSTQQATTSVTPGAVYDSFLGLSMTVPQDAPPPFHATDCLQVVIPASPSGENPSVGQVYQACGAGPFPPQIVLIIDGASPLALRNRYALGTALLFIGRGPTVGVFVPSDGFGTINARPERIR